MPPEKIQRNKKEEMIIQDQTHDENKKEINNRERQGLDNDQNQNKDVRKKIQSELQRIIESSERLNKQICRILVNNVNQWETQTSDKKKQNATFYNAIERLISRIEKLEHTTTSLLTGLREHIVTIISLMEEIKPTETKNEETWRKLIT